MGCVVGVRCKKLVLAEPINNASFVDVVGGHLQLHTVTSGEADEAFAHLSGNMSEDDMIVRELDTKHRAGEDGRDPAFELDRFFR